jgi:hypothetical protein
VPGNLSQVGVVDASDAKMSDIGMAALMGADV